MYDALPLVLILRGAGLPGLPGEDPAMRSPGHPAAQSGFGHQGTLHRLLCAQGRRCDTQVLRSRNRAALMGLTCLA
jgi:hypothetical protein